MFHRQRFRNANMAYAMAKAGVNNARLAKLCSLHVITVSALLNQRRDPTPKTAAAIARALNCKPRHLFPEVI